MLQRNYIASDETLIEEVLPVAKLEQWRYNQAKIRPVEMLQRKVCLWQTLIKGIISQAMKR